MYVIGLKQYIMINRKTTLIATSNYKLGVHHHNGCDVATMANYFNHYDL